MNVEIFIVIFPSFSNNISFISIDCSSLIAYCLLLIAIPPLEQSIQLRINLIDDIAQVFFLLREPVIIHVDDE